MTVECVKATVLGPLLMMSGLPLAASVSAAEMLKLFPFFVTSMRAQEGIDTAAGMVSGYLREADR